MDQRKQQQREAIRAQCEARGIKLEQRECSYRLTGPGVDLICSDLANLDANDLRPQQPRKHVEP